jgi:hypothetical protein
MVLEFSKFEWTRMHQNQNSHKPRSRHNNYFNVQHLNGFQALTLPMSQSLCKSHLLLDLQRLQATPTQKKHYRICKRAKRIPSTKVVRSSSFIIIPPPWQFELCTAAHYQCSINYFFFFFLCFHIILNNIFIYYVNIKFNLN